MELLDAIYDRHNANLIDGTSLLRNPAAVVVNVTIWQWLNQWQIPKLVKFAY